MDVASPDQPGAPAAVQSGAGGAEAGSPPAIAPLTFETLQGGDPALVKELSALSERLVSYRERVMVALMHARTWVVLGSDEVVGATVPAWRAQGEDFQVELHLSSGTRVGRRGKASAWTRLEAHLKERFTSATLVESSNPVDVSRYRLATGAVDE